MNTNIETLNINLEDETQMEHLHDIVELYHAANTIKEWSIHFKNAYKMHPENEPRMMEEENRRLEKQHAEVCRLEQQIDELEKKGRFTQELASAKLDLQDWMDIIDEESRFPGFCIQTCFDCTLDALRTIERTYPKVAKLPNIHFGKLITPSIIQFWRRLHKAYFPEKNLTFAV